MVDKPVDWHAALGKLFHDMPLAVFVPDFYMAYAAKDMVWKHTIALDHIGWIGQNIFCRRSYIVHRLGTGRGLLPPVESNLPLTRSRCSLNATPSRWNERAEQQAPRKSSGRRFHVSPSGCPQGRAEKYASVAAPHSPGCRATNTAQNQARPGDGKPERARLGSGTRVVRRLRRSNRSAAAMFRSFWLTGRREQVLGGNSRRSGWRIFPHGIATRFRPAGRRPSLPCAGFCGLR